MMKRILNLGLVVLMVSLFAACAGGGDDNGGDPTPQPTPEQQRVTQLAGTANKTWRATSITLNGAPAQNYNTATFSLSFTTTRTYSTQAGDPIFRPSGAWNFRDGNLNQLIFDNDPNVVANISNLNTQGTQMTLTIDFQLRSSSARVDAINGTYVFTLTSN